MSWYSWLWSERDPLDNIKKLNLQYGTDVFTTKISLAADEIKHSGPTVIFCYTKDSDQTWLDYFLKIRGGDKQLNADCRMAVCLIDLFINRHKSDYFEITIFPNKHDFIYLKQPKVDYVLAHYIDVHPGIWLYQDGEEYIGLGDSGIERKDKDYWYSFLERSRNEQNYELVQDSNPFYVFKMEDEYYLVLDRLCDNYIIVEEDHIKVYVYDEKRIILDLDGIDIVILDFIETDKESVISMNMSTEWESFIIEVDLGKKCDFVCHKPIRNVRFKIVSEDLDKIFHLLKSIV